MSRRIHDSLPIRVADVDYSRMTLNWRTYNDAADYELIRDMLQANNRASSSLSILDWRRFITQANAVTLPQMRLWLDGNGGTLRAFVWPDFGGSEIITRTGDDDAFANILDCEEAQATSARQPLRIVLDERDAARTTLLTGRGYQPAPEISFYSMRSLGEPIPSPYLPEGYAFACVANLPGLEGRAATERAAMPWSSTTASTYRAIQAMPDYRADLDLAVIDAAGDVAAFCTFWAEPVAGIGVVEPIGCHPAHQRRGLGRALLYEGFRRLHALGFRDVYVGNGPAPETLETPGPARRLTALVGFRRVTRKYTWWRAIPNTVTLSEFFRQSPLLGSDIDLTREDSPLPVDLDFD